MWTWIVYISPNGETKTSDDVKYGLILLFLARKKIVRSVILLAALLLLALLLSFCGRLFFWIGISLLAADCGIWLACKRAKKPWSVSIQLHQFMTVEYIRTLTLPCDDKMRRFPAEATGSRIFRSITSGIFGFLSGALSFPFLIPYRLRVDISFLMLRLPEFITYFQEAIERNAREMQEKEEREKEESFKESAFFYADVSLFEGYYECKDQLDFE